jgi:hypothetical protein
MAALYSKIASLKLTQRVERMEHGAEAEDGATRNEDAVGVGERETRPRSRTERDGTKDRATRVNKMQAALENEKRDRAAEQKEMEQKLALENETRDRAVEKKEMEQIDGAK